MLAERLGPSVQDSMCSGRSQGQLSGLVAAADFCQMAGAQHLQAGRLQLDVQWARLLPAFTQDDVGPLQAASDDIPAAQLGEETQAVDHEPKFHLGHAEFPTTILRFDQEVAGNCELTGATMERVIKAEDPGLLPVARFSRQGERPVPALPHRVGVAGVRVVGPERTEQLARHGVILGTGAQVRRRAAGRAESHRAGRALRGSEAYVPYKPL